MTEPVKIWEAQSEHVKIANDELRVLLKRVNAVDAARMFFAAVKLDGSSTPIETCVIGIEQDSQKVNDSVLRAVRSRGDISLESAIHQGIDDICQDQWRTYISRLNEVEGWRVAVVVQLSVAYLNRPYWVSAEALGKPNGFHVCSVIDSIARVFANECCNGLRPPLNGLRTFVSDPESLLRVAGNHQMISASGGQLRSSRFNFSYSACNRISSTFDGRSVCQGKIIFCHREQQTISPTFTFKTEVPLYDHFAIRKLLKSTDKQYGLLCDKGWVYAIGSLPEGTSTDVYEVDFLGPSLWQLKHANQIVMTVHQGIPSLPASERFNTRASQILRRVFNNLTEERLNPLMELINEMSTLSGGGILVIADDAEQEAERLESQGTTTVPFHVTSDIIDRLSRMGGAILISPDGQCHAVGVKLDGKANRKFSASRGARYNAAVRYVCGEATSGRVAIVKSEDGMLDVLSTLHQASE